ncbi:MAG TPA: PBP1A family penicillin-binding protein [Termitinemataceae bacterium]|nr:PBP1A family penicillin-binding protein [Termitinemataceae bacterium]HOM23063.1 PBP1A family penicillin-binding protein [Termitinemataceae bacterium]HPP99913.1 PBP1A family penicillin-binding protein [Termitinemataceae bacterium]
MTSTSKKSSPSSRWFKVLLVLIIGSAIFLGLGMGLFLAETINVKNIENFTEFTPALPTKVLDINGNLITEFSAEEKREIISLQDVPPHLIQAVLAREDPDFYHHHGFSIKAIMRALVGQIIGKNLGGGSTITQQLAGTLYADRSERTIMRKLRELWWALQLERRYTKNEILELYLNKMYMGAGTYGVEAASKFYFGHSVRDITLAEAAILVIQLSSPARYNPLDNPNIARDRQKAVLDKMVSLGYVTKEEAERSFNEYWDNYDYTRVSTSAYFSRSDKAPWFSEYVRRQLEQMLYGSMDIYKDGFVVHTTLDLNFQAVADRQMALGLANANEEFKKTQSTRLTTAENLYIPIVQLLSLAFGIDEINSAGEAQVENRVMGRYSERVNPVIDVLALMFNVQELKPLTNTAYAQLKAMAEKNTVEGALITIENETGYIKALVGGSKYDQSNQLIRAVQAKVMPGSSFKPLYYSAAIDTRKITPATLIYDAPIVFYNEDGTPYLPQNYKGNWYGPVLVWRALALSLNVPSLKILDTIGFDAAIDRAALLLGITDPKEKARVFPRVYPLGLGIIGVSPLQMARAFAVFANQGREVTPIAIRAVEDRNGKVILDPEKELRLQQKRRGSATQLISPQNAYIMTSLLRKTVESGTLSYRTARGTKFTYTDSSGKRYTIPVAAKTGTTQNWADVWVVGYSPYYSTAVWFGFDKPGNSLGVTQTGESIAGPVWVEYMRAIHEGLPMKEFVRPSTGIVEVTVCARSGLLPTSNCTDGLVTLPFLEGTQPTQYCDLHENLTSQRQWGLETLREDTIHLENSGILDQLRMPELNLDLLPPTPSNSSENSENSGESTPADGNISP